MCRHHHHRTTTAIIVIAASRAHFTSQLTSRDKSCDNYADTNGSRNDDDDDNENSDDETREQMCAYDDADADDVVEVKWTINTQRPRFEQQAIQPRRINTYTKKQTCQIIANHNEIVLLISMPFIAFTFEESNKLSARSTLTFN